jgi:thiamine-phosphate pyrophosphorylase
LTWRALGARGDTLLLYYITDRHQFLGNPADKESRLLAKIAQCAAAGVDFIQLREKDLSVRELEVLAGKAVDAIPAGSTTRLLINSRIDVALASGAHGVHLPSNDLSAAEAREVYALACAEKALIGVSTHSLEEVVAAGEQGADLVVFAPVFEKSGQANPRGLAALQEVCRRGKTGAPKIPVLALGGVTRENAKACLHAGAAGIAAIRLFQENDVQETVRHLRALR